MSMHVTTSSSNFSDRTHAKKFTFALTRARRSAFFAVSGSVVATAASSKRLALLVFVNATFSGTDCCRRFGFLGRIASLDCLHTVNHPHSSQ
jgi:hypothetical protein